MSSAKSLSLSVDIGGTFTDIVAYSESAQLLYTHKELTTASEPERGVITGIRHLLEREGLDIADVHRVVHATTLFTNAIIERKGALTGLVTTTGFRDVLEIGSERKYELYDLFLKMPQPLVKRSLRCEVDERISSKGQVEKTLDTAMLIERVEMLRGRGVTSLAIVLLHSYANPTHEQQARDLIAERFPDLFVSISSDISPRIREYERTSTTVANAYIKPIADRYLKRLSQELTEAGSRAELQLMLSNGGLTNINEARRKPIEMLESGPAAGAIAGSFFGARSDALNVLAFDMGGTTAKLSMIDEGKPHVAYKFEAARQKRFAEGSGLPITISTVELIEIGAGGGSIAHLDSLGLMKVGPESASSDPGPACYMRGGTRPTVTDANLVLGYLDPEFFAGGTIKISREAAVAALTPLAEAARLSVTEVAWGIHNIVNENMASAARVHVAERGKDPRRYALLTTGGGGPMHGCEVARKLGLATVVCPPSAGVASAVGLLVAPARVDRDATVAMPMNAPDWPGLEASYQLLESDARGVLTDTGIADDTVVMSRFADIRYVGQGFEVVVALPGGPYSAETKTSIVSAFETAYRQVFSRTPIGTGIEIVNIRVSASAPASRTEPKTSRAGQAGHQRPRKERRVYYGSARDFVVTPVFDRAALVPGSSVKGPAVIEEAESTLIVPPDAIAAVEAQGNLVIKLPVQAASRSMRADAKVDA